MLAGFGVEGINLRLKRNNSAVHSRWQKWTSRTREGVFCPHDVSGFSANKGCDPTIQLI